MHMESGTREDKLVLSAAGIGVSFESMAPHQRGGAGIGAAGCALAWGGFPGLCRDAQVRSGEPEKARKAEDGVT
jgi:hypothetical protein